MRRRLDERRPGSRHIPKPERYTLTRQLTHLDLVRRDAQDLHKKISANIALAEKATWADVQTVQTEAASLVGKMTSIAEEQADAIKSDVKAAIVKLEAAAKLVQDKAVDGQDAVKRANAALLASAHKAAQILSYAVAEMRTKAAKAIEPKTVTT